MKRGVIAIFLLLTTMVFAEDSQIDEARELRERVVKLETIIERMEKERLTSIDYYESSFEDSKEYYKNTLEDSKEIYENGLSSVRWTVGISSTILAIVMALLGVILAWVKISSDKKLEAEKKEIKESNARDLQGLKDENKKLLDEIIKLEEKLSSSFKEENEKLNGKIEKIDDSIKKIDKQTEEIREKHIETKINAEITEALSKKTDEEKYHELKKLEKELGNFPKEFKEELYFLIAYFSSDMDEKIDYSSRAIKLNPNNSKGYIIKGAALCKTEDFEGAIRNYTEAINSISHLSIFYCKRAELYIEKGQLDDAFEDLIKDITRGNEGEFYLKVSKEKYDKFLKFIEGKPDRTGLENEVLRRVEKMEGITIVD